MKDNTTVPDQARTASRRGFLAGGLGVGAAVAAGALAGAAVAGERDARQGSAGDGGRAELAHGGAIHTQMHGGVAHTHDKVSHTHEVMVHALDARTLRVVDTNGRPATSS